MIRAVVFDLDGVLLDSEQLWDEARRELVEDHGGRWTPAATADMQGMSATEWSGYLHDRLGVGLEPERIVDSVVAMLRQRYRHDLPLLPGGVRTVRRLAERWPLGLASSANRVIIDEVLSAAGLADLFQATVSSEEVSRGKPEPDVYLEAARRLGQPPESCTAIEDSANGIRSAASAGLAVVAIPNPHFPPAPEALALAAVVVERLADLTPDLIAQLDRRRPPAFDPQLDEQELESFPASDPHSDWAGPPG